MFSIPDFALVLVAGSPDAGRDAFVNARFAAEETCAVIPEGARSTVPFGFAGATAPIDGAETQLGMRLAHRKLACAVVSDPTPQIRKRFATLARFHHAPYIGVGFGISDKVMKTERGRRGFDHVIAFPEAETSATAIRFQRVPLTCDRRQETGPFDIIGDVHGCAGELESLLERLDYRVVREGEAGLRRYSVIPPKGRKAIFVGDLVDRGPRSPDALRLVQSMVSAKQGLCVIGNHDDKFLRWLKGRDVSMSHGLAETVRQVAEQESGFGNVIRPFLQDLPSHLVLDGGRLVIAHAGLPEELHNRQSGKVRSFAMYGETTGKVDRDGIPERIDWAASYRGEAVVVQGHTPVQEAEWFNRTICIDTGCVYGGRLIALRWPERDLVSVDAERQWSAPKRPLLPPRNGAARHPS
ncbi:MAG: metallophosphoesterase [Pseudomonadota bacterium]